MDESYELKDIWMKGGASERQGLRLTEKDLQAIIAARVRKEFKTVGGYVWAAIVYQIILTSFLAHTLVRNWGNMHIVLLCLAGVGLCVPLTALLLRRSKSLFARDPLEPAGVPAPGLRRAVETEHARLAAFFQLKKRLDWVGVPLSCAIIVVVTFSLFVVGGIETHPLGAALLFAIWVGMSLIAIRSENKKRFIGPLRQLALVLDDLRRS
jgi:hypothetical protein